jgi:general secretion pathway protein K
VTPCLKKFAGESRACAAASGSDGFIIVAVLWMLVALTTLVSIYVVYVVNTAHAVGINEDRPRLDALVLAALELTAYQANAVEGSKRPTTGGFSFRLGKARASVDYRSEAARIDLNAASKSLIAGLFSGLGAPAALAEEFADRIVAWRTSTNAANAGAQDEDAAAYRSAGRSYRPRRAPFPHVGELWLVLGMPADLVNKAMPYLTVYSGRPEINIVDAPPAVVAALPEMSPQRLFALLNERAAGTRDTQLLESIPQAARSAVTLEGSPAMRVSIEIQSDGGRQARFEAVILLLDNAAEPYRVLSWHSDYDDAIRRNP